MEIQQKYIQIESLLVQVQDIIINEIGYNPYQDLDKILKIISQKNYNQISAVNKKIKNLTIIIYNQRSNFNETILDKLDKIYRLINEK